MSRIPTILVAYFVVGLGCAEPEVSDGGMCSPTEEPFSVGDVIAFSRFDVAVGDWCDGSYVAAEDHAVWVAERWGEAPYPFDYGVFASDEHPCWPCEFDGLEALACANQGEWVAATTVPHRHEIAHAVRTQRCHPILEEGWASLHGDAFRDATTDGDMRGVLDEMQGGPLPGDAYGLAARFSAFLLETRGIEAFKAACSASGTSTASLEAAVLEAYGEPLDSLLTEFEAVPEFSLGQLRQDSRCEGSVAASLPASLEFSLDCTAASIEGQRAGKLVVDALVELDVDGAYEFVFIGDRGAELWVELRNCSIDTGGYASAHYQTEVVYLVDGPESLVLFDLPAGEYTIRTLAPTELGALTVAVSHWP